MGFALPRSVRCANPPEVTFGAGTVLDLAGNDLGALDTSASWLLGDFFRTKTRGTNKSGEINQPNEPFLGGIFRIFMTFIYFFAIKKGPR